MEFQPTQAEKLVSEDIKNGDYVKATVVLIYHYLGIYLKDLNFPKCNEPGFCFRENVMGRLATYKSYFKYKKNLDEIMELLNMTDREYNEWCDNERSKK